MSLFDHSRKAGRTVAIALALGTTFALQACQVQPLYYSGSSTHQMLSSVAIKPVDNRVAQELRNELIFLYSGGAGEPADPQYQMKLNVTGQSSRALREDLTNGISARRYSAVATFTITRAATGEVIYTGKRRVTTFYDQNTQEFAKNRALRDAETRAAKQLAEIIRADTAAILSRTS